jgi:hypothetical protein
MYLNIGEKGVKNGALVKMFIKRVMVSGSTPLWWHEDRRLG